MTSDCLPSPGRLSDDQLDAEVKRLVGCERGVTAELIAHLAEFDARRLYLAKAFASLFAYCTGALRLSEHEAYNRIEAARASRRFPLVLELLREGAVNLTTIRLLAPHLTRENHEELLGSASAKSRREVEELLAERFPRPAVPSSVRRLPDGPAAVTALASSTTPEASTVTTDAVPTAAIGETPATSPRVFEVSLTPTFSLPKDRATLAPLAPNRYKVTFTASGDTHQKLRRAQDLLRHQIPDGNPAEIFDRALSALLEALERRKAAATARPRPSRGSGLESRHIPAEVRRAVWRRDDGRCAFLGDEGRRCAERGFLEFHHAQPYAAAGSASVANIALRCRAHNGYEAELYFGPTRPTVGLGSATRSETSSPPAAADQQQ